MQWKPNKSMLSLTKSINVPSTASAESATPSTSTAIPTILSRIERTSSGRFVVKKANSVDDECSSEAISSCSDNDDKLSASKCHRLAETDKCHHHNSSMHYDGDEEDGNDDDDESSDDSDADLMLDNFDVTLVDDDSYESPKNDAERMFLEVVEVLRYEQEVRRNGIVKLLYEARCYQRHVRSLRKPNESERGEAKNCSGVLCCRTVLCHAATGFNFYRQLFTCICV
jgi:hypothetical protein